MITAIHDAAWVNRIVNDPSVRPYVAPGDEDLDLSGLMETPGNIVLGTDRGCFILQRYVPGVYEVHTAFRPEGRGRHVLRAMRDAMGWMFLRTDCMELLTQIPKDNTRAEWLARQAGFELTFERERGYMGPTQYFELVYPQWVRGAPGLVERGQWFHQRLEQARGAPPDHDDDPAHDRYVGAAVGMILAGQVAKAIHLYNRWARFAGYAPVAVRSTDPLTIDIGDSVIQVVDNDFHIVG